ncbi:MAG: hypothetical protein ABW189_03095 [Rickettsiales bacterium]
MRFRSPFFRLACLTCMGTLCLFLSGCDTALGHRMKIAKDGLFARLRGKKPTNEYGAHYNLDRNLDSEQEKRLFLYRYYPDYYEQGEQRSMEATGSPPASVPFPPAAPAMPSSQAPVYDSPASDIYE